MGKSTLIDILALRGYKIVPEAAKMIIEEQQAGDGNIFPWTDLSKFQELVAERQIDNEERVHDGLIFLDRGIIDGYAYCRFGNVPVPVKISNLARGRYNKVFLLEPLPNYENDSIRKETFKFQTAIHEAIKKSYEEFGYDICEVPVLNPEERVNFVLGQLDQCDY